MDYGEWLRGARERAGLTQAELAERVGMRQPNLARLEKREKAPRKATVERLEVALGQSNGVAGASVQPEVPVLPTQEAAVLRVPPVNVQPSSDQKASISAEEWRQRKHQALMKALDMDKPKEVFVDHAEERCDNCSTEGCPRHGEHTKRPKQCEAYES